MLKILKQEPAVLIGFLGAVVAAAAQVQQTAALSGWWAAVTVGVPLVAGILTRFHVVPVEVVRTVIAGARTTGRAVEVLADKVALEMVERPREAG